MAKANVVVDLTKLIKAKGFDDISSILKEKCGEKIFDQLEDLQEALEDALDELGQLEYELKYRLMVETVGSNDILDQIMDVLKLNDVNDDPNNLFENLFKNSIVANNLDLADNITKYIQAYDKAYALTVNSITNLDKIAEAIRGDTQLFTIGLGANKSIKEAILNIDQMHRFMLQRDKFMLSWDEESGQYNFGLRNDLNKTKMARGLLIAQAGNDVQRLSQIAGMTDYEAREQFAVNNPVTQQIWKVLQQSTIYSSASINKFLSTGQKKDLYAITSARKYEILHMSIWEDLYANPNNISDDLIRNIINNQFGSTNYDEKGNILNFSKGKLGTGFDLDNIAGFARGDTLIKTMTNSYGIQNISTQQKYYGGGFGFNMEKTGTIFNALKFWKDEQNLQNISSDIQQELINSGQLDNDILESVEDYSGFLAYKENAAYDQTGGMNYNEDTGFSFYEDINLVFDA